jgi:hypothetical protein
MVKMKKNEGKAEKQNWVWILELIILVLIVVGLAYTITPSVQYTCGDQFIPQTLYSDTISTGSCHYTVTRSVPLIALVILLYLVFTFIR